MQAPDRNPKRKANKAPEGGARPLSTERKLSFGQVAGIRDVTHEPQSTVAWQWDRGTQTLNRIPVELVNSPLAGLVSGHTSTAKTALWDQPAETEQPQE